MALVNSRQTLKDYCMRRLGWPVIQINVDDDQIDDRIDDALQYFQDYHFDGMEKVYLRHYVSQTDVDRQFINMNEASGTATIIANSNVVIGSSATNFIQDFAPGITSLTINGETKKVANANASNFMVMDSVFSSGANNVPITVVGGADSIFAVTRVFPLSSTNATVNMFDLRYQLRLHELYDFTSTSYVNYVITQQHLRTLEMLFSGEPQTRFSRHQNRLYVDLIWGKEINVGEYLLIEAYKLIHPDAFVSVYNDRYLKALATAMIKFQWGQNLSKYSGIQLPGGITFDGARIAAEAKDEMDKLIEQIQDRYETPPVFYVG